MTLNGTATHERGDYRGDQALIRLIEAVALLRYNDKLELANMKEREKSAFNVQISEIRNGYLGYWIRFCHFDYLVSSCSTIDLI